MKNENYLLNFVKYFSIDGIILHYSTRQFNSEEQEKKGKKELSCQNQPNSCIAEWIKKIITSFTPLESHEVPGGRGAPWFYFNENLPKTRDC